MDAVSTVLRLKEKGIICEGGHFALDSTVHSSAYFDKEKCDGGEMDLLCRLLGREIAAAIKWPAKRQVEAIVSPPGETAAIIRDGISRFLHLTLRQREERVFPHFSLKERERVGTLNPRRSLAVPARYKEWLSGKSVLVADDIVVTGRSIQEVVNAISGCGANVVAAGVFLNWSRAGATKLGLACPLVSALDPSAISFEVWPQEKCPRCQAKVPLDATGGCTKE